MNINHVVMTGNLTRDPELRNTAGGTAILTFSVAVNDSRKDANGEWKDYPNFIDCTMFGKRAESLATILHKGTKVGIVGKLHWSSWEKDGQKRSKVDVKVDEVELLTPKRDNDFKAAESELGVPMQDVTVYDSDIPF